MLYYATKKYVFEVTKNEDGTVTLHPEIENAGELIMQRGGVDGFLSACVEDERDFNEFIQDKALIKAMRNRYKSWMRVINEMSEAEKAKQAYAGLLAKYGMDIDHIDKEKKIESTAENLCTIMRYLCTINWGMWELPRLTQGYEANQVDCGGKIAVTVSLDEGLVSASTGCLVKHLQYGAPMGYLNDFKSLRGL